MSLITKFINNSKLIIAWWKKERERERETEREFFSIK